MCKLCNEKLPDPWLFDSESLLRELDRCREFVLVYDESGDILMATVRASRIFRPGAWTDIM